MGDYSRLNYQHVGDVLVVRPLVRVLGPWDGLDDRPAEAVEFRDQLRQLLDADAGPLLLDIRGFPFARNWLWFLVPLAKDFKVQGRKWMICVQPRVAEAFAITKFDRVLPIGTDLDEAVVTLSQAGH
ncbi:MAG: STAS domain-containing protein [Planctomycetota bacterium]|nr:STAS domain-containing protein [Planctomycetota bacterium]